jgi:hypothetical protein
LGCLRRVPGGGGVDSMLWFQLERGHIEATGWSIDRRRSGVNELVLAPWNKSVTRRGGVTTSTGGEAAPGRGKGGDNINWADANLTG